MLFSLPAHKLEKVDASQETGDGNRGWTKIFRGKENKNRDSRRAPQHERPRKNRASGAEETRTYGAWISLGIGSMCTNSEKENLDAA